MGYEGGTEAGRLCIDCLDDLFLKQHVEGATRMEATLDLVISRDEEAVVDLEILDRFSTSDHNMVFFSIVYGGEERSKEQKCLDYKRADFESIRKELIEMDWCSELNGTADESWLKLRNLLLQLESKHVPLKKMGSRRKAIWMTHKAANLVRRRKRVYSKYKDPLHPAYLNAADQAVSELRKAARNFEMKLAKKIKQDMLCLCA